MKVLKFSGVILRLSATPQLYYDESGETLFVVDDGTVYKYKDIPVSAWLIIKGGDLDFFDMLTEVMPYSIVPNIPKTRRLLCGWWIVQILNMSAMTAKRGVYMFSFSRGTLTFISV